jgi:hypothetical protein
MKELLGIMGLVLLIAILDWVSVELSKEANWFIALAFASVFTYFVIQVVKEMKK